MLENVNTVTIPLSEYNKLIDNQLSNCVRLGVSALTKDLVVSIDSQKLYEVAISLIARQVAVDPGMYDVLHFDKFFVCDALIASPRESELEVQPYAAE